MSQPRKKSMMRHLTAAVVGALGLVAAETVKAIDWSGVRSAPTISDPMEQDVWRRFGEFQAMRLACGSKPCDAEQWKQYNERRPKLLAKYGYCKIVSACTEDEKTKIARDQYVVWGEASYSARRHLDQFLSSSEATDAPDIPKGIRGLNNAMKLFILLWPTDVYQDNFKWLKVQLIRAGVLDPDPNMTPEGGQGLGQIGWERAETRARDYARDPDKFYLNLRRGQSHVSRAAPPMPKPQSDASDLPRTASPAGPTAEARIYRTIEDMTGTYFLWTNGDISYVSKSGTGNFGPAVNASNFGAGTANIHGSPVANAGPSTVHRDVAAGGRASTNGNRPYIKIDPTFMHGVRGDGANGDIYYLDGSNGPSQAQQSASRPGQQTSPTSSQTISPAKGSPSRSDTPFTDLAVQIFGPTPDSGDLGPQVASVPLAADPPQSKIDAASYQKAVLDRLKAMDAKTFGNSNTEASRYALMVIPDAYKNGEPPDAAAEHIKKLTGDFLKRRKETADARKKASQPVVRRPTVAAPTEPEVAGDSSVDYSEAASALLGIAGAVAPMVGRVRVPAATVRAPVPAVRAPAAAVSAPVIRTPAASQSTITGLGR
jgi:hypothetical protein